MECRPYDPSTDAAFFPGGQPGGPLWYPQVVAWTLLMQGVPVLAFGFRPLWEGVAFGWMETTADAQCYKMAIARQLDRMRPVLHQFRRVETLVYADNLPAQRLNEWLGFQFCCRKVHYGPQGETMLEYVWLKEGVADAR